MTKTPKLTRPAHTSEIDYVSRRTPWMGAAGVRHWTPPTRDTAPGKFGFSPDLVALARHPAIVGRAGAVEAVLDAHGDRFVDFTETLELAAVVPVCLALRQGQTPFGVPATLAREAGDVAIDEIWHARCAVAVRGTTPASASPAFLNVLAQTRAGLDLRRSALAGTIFTSVSETLITGTLNRAPLDIRVRSEVRDTLREHAREEAFHHAMFGQVIGILWGQMTEADRDALGPLYARYIRAFLSSDLRSEVKVLGGIGFTPDEARRIVAEASEIGGTHSAVREAARATLRFLECCGALDHDPTRHALETEGLMA